MRASLFLAAFFLASAASPASAAIIATQKSSTPFPGVTLVEGTTRAPSSTFHAAKVLLCTQGVRVRATTAPAALRTVPSWAASANVQLATNGDFFKPDPRVYGMAIGDGVPWPIEKTGIDPAVKDQYYYDLFGWIAFGPDFVEFTHTKYVKEHASPTQGFSPKAVSHDFPKGTVALVSGFPEIVTEGKRVSCTDPTASTCFVDRTDMRSRNPRTLMGLSQDRKTFILAVVDGRSATSAGMYGTELAELAEELGAWQAFNIDGGGSSEMWVEGKGTINAPSDGASRAVANHWGIVAAGAGAAAHCLPAPPKDAGADAEPDAAPPPSGERDASTATPNPEPSSGGSDAPAPNGSDGGCSLAPGPSHTGGVVELVFALAAGLAARRRRRA